MPFRHVKSQRIVNVDAKIERDNSAVFTQLDSILSIFESLKGLGNRQ